MKSKFIILLLCLSCFFAGCNWQIPEKVTVKSEPTFNFCAGTVKTDFSETLNFDEILFDAINATDSSVKAYNYLPEGKVHQYAIRMSVVDVPVDFSSFFENTGISEALKGMSFEQEIEVPDVSFDKKEEIDVSKVKQAINASIYYLSDESGSKFSSKFDSIVYDNITFNFRGDYPDGTMIEIYSAGKSVSGYVYGNEAVLSTSSFTLDQSNFTVSLYSSAGSNIPYVINVDKNSNIREIKNLTSPVPISFPFEISFSLKNNENSFKSCVIEDGDLFTSLNVPESWKGVNVSYDFTTTGALDVEAKKDTGLQKTIPLNGKELKNNSTNAKSTIEMSIKNADIAFAPNQNLKLNVSSDIRKLSSLTITLDSVNPKMEMTEPLSTEMMETIRLIDLDVGSGIEIDYTNTLPSENDITLKAASDFFGLNGESRLESMQENKNKIVSDNEKRILIGNEPGQYNSYDFKVELILPGATGENPNDITIKNISMGEKYSLKVNVKPVINWTRIVLSNKLTESLSVKDKISLPFSLGDFSESMSSVFGDDSLISKLKIKSIPVYLFCTKPTVIEGKKDPFEDMSFSGNISLYYGTENECKKDETGKELKESLSGDDGKINFISLPNFEFSKNAKSLLTDLSTVRTSASTDIADLLNQPSDDTNSLFIDYDLTFSSSSTGELEITNDMLDTKCSLSVFSYIILPLEFITDGEVNFNANEMAGDVLVGDIFGRTDENQSLNNSFENYIDYMKSAKIMYESISLPIKTDNKESMQLKLEMNCGNGESLDLSKDGAFLNGGEFDITSEKVKIMLKNYPAIPDFSIKIENGTVFYIPQKMDVAIKLSLSVETDIKIDF